mgnify:CR=1 FL=1
MAGKTEASTAAPGKPEGAKSEEKAETPAVPAAPAGPGRLMPWLPVVAALVLSPVATWSAVEFVVLPRLQKKLAAPVVPEAAPAAGKGEASAGREGGKGEGAPNYEFNNVVVNLAGTMGTRYLKTSFLVAGAAGSNIGAVFEADKPRLTDVTLNVLSSLTLADLEEPGAKNVIREKLVASYNQTLGRKVADQVYFSDFVIQ